LAMRTVYRGDFIRPQATDECSIDTSVANFRT
jgi:hypothetical protein